MPEDETVLQVVDKYVARLAAKYGDTAMHTDPFREEHKPLDPAASAKIDEIKATASQLYAMLARIEGRESSIAKTKLEESVLWAVKGLMA